MRKKYIELELWFPALAGYCIPITLLFWYILGGLKSVRLDVGFKTLLACISMVRASFFLMIYTLLCVKKFFTEERVRLCAPLFNKQALVLL
ncbi:hypothetical protein [Massilia glaciei]|uniref:Uncharacterized protein n=1 Tax=Massilia glaciei TaxID=1524097 RepID=A0A2U2HN26_9BURK|nr:hypothetical protein [Massilia glaciei]PWF48903.1 hypothetical protein C7C56_009295 [Massilia glaciei]